MRKKTNDEVDNRAYKFRIYPTDEQEVLIRKTIGCARLIYNCLLHYKQQHYKDTKKMLKREVTYYKKQEKYSFLSEVDSLALANAKLNLDSAYKNFFEGRTELPKFKKKGPSGSYKTNFTNGNIAIIGKNIKLPKLGAVKLKQHRLIGKDEMIKNVTVSCEAGKFYVSIITERPKIKVVPVDVSKNLEARTIGFDYSVPSFYVDSNGNIAGYPKYYREMQAKLAKEQAKLSRMIKNSKNYKKQQIKVQRIHKKVANQRLDFLHQLSRNLVNSYDVFVFEDIDLNALKKCLNFGKTVSDEGFGMFRDFVKYKAEREGKYFIKIDKWFASTKTCGKCGTKNPEVTLGVQEWTCPVCGEHHLRDENAAINIKVEGMRILLEMFTELEEK